MQRSAEIISMYSTSRNPHKFVGASGEQIFCLHPNPAIEGGQAISTVSMMNQAIHPPKTESIIVYETLPAVTYI